MFFEETNKPSSVEPVSEAGLSPVPRPAFPSFVTVATDGLPTVICLVRGCYGVSLVVWGVSRSFSGVSERGHVLRVVGFKLYI